MVKGLMVIMALSAVAIAAQAEPTPLMPHPPERLNEKPVYSQDHYVHDARLQEPPAEIEAPSYSQDRYGKPENGDDYADQLRKVPDKGHEWSEIEIAKGIVALNGQNFDEANKHFESALAHDPRNFVAYEYLSNVAERKEDPQAALGYLAKAKHIAPTARWGQLNFQIGRIYLMMKNHERAEIYLRLAISEGGQLTAVSYTLGYLLYLDERYFEAEHYLHEARMRAIRRTALGAEREMLQAINYYLGEIYARLGFTQYSIVCLRDTEIGDSWEVRQAAWRVHSEINHFNYYVTLGAFAQFDTNVVVVPVGGTLPTSFSSQGGPGSVLTANGGVQTSPTNAWIAGLDGLLYMNNHINKTLRAFDVLNYGLDAWGSYWNRRDWTFTLRYDFNNVLTDRSNYSLFQRTLGPMVSANYFPFQRWNWEFGSQLRFNSFATDPLTGPDRRSGQTYVLFFRTSLRSPNPRLRPTFGLTFEQDRAQGENFLSDTYTGLAELDYRLFDRTHLVAGLTFSKGYYPDNVQGRRDTVMQQRMSLNHIVNEHWMAIFDLTQFEDDSTNASFSYKRIVGSGGVTYTF